MDKEIHNVSDKVLLINHAIIHGNNNTVIGNNNHISGSNNNVHGNDTIIYGDGNNTLGNFNTITGKNNTVKGNDNKIYGDFNDVTGNQNLINGNSNNIDGIGNSYMGNYNNIICKVSYPPQICSVSGVERESSYSKTNVLQQIDHSTLNLRNHSLVKSSITPITPIKEEKISSCSLQKTDSGSVGNPLDSTQFSEETNQIKIKFKGSDNETKIDDLHCCICLVNQKCVLLSCCDTVVWCLECAKKCLFVDGGTSTFVKKIGSEKCPMCRKNITKATRIFI